MLESATMRRTPSRTSIRSPGIGLKDERPASIVDRRTSNNDVATLSNLISSVFINPMSKLQLRVRAEISSQIFRVEAPGWQGAKGQEYLAYSELSQRSQPGCIGAKNVKLFLREP